VTASDTPLARPSPSSEPLPLAPPPSADTLPRGPSFGRRLLRNRAGAIGLALVGLFLVTALVSLVWTPYPYLETHPRDRLQGPSAKYWMGTDDQGRDILSRVMRGANTSLRVALLAVSLAAMVGVVLGLISGYWGGWADQLTMRGMDIIFAFPSILLALGIVAALGTGWVKTSIAIAIVYIPIFARVTRGPVLSVKETEYVTAATAVGVGTPRLLGGHILPNITAPVIVQVTLALSWAILTEAALSFVGLGTQLPEPSWGNMLNESRRLLEFNPWMAVFPGLAIMLAVLGFNLLGDALRDLLDPRLRGAR